MDAELLPRAADAGTVLDGSDMAGATHEGLFVEIAIRQRKGRWSSRVFHY